MSSELDELEDLDDSLLASFTNVVEVLPDRVMVIAGGETLHRIEPGTDEPRPGCHPAHYNDGEFVVTTPQKALNKHYRPCRNCFRAVLEYLAHDENSPVEYVGDDDAYSEWEADVELPVADGSGVANTRDVRPLQTLTDEVLLGSSGGKMHAPTPDGALCQTSFDGRSRVVERAAVESHYEPCGHCFDLSD